jgi:hypothetical protein
LSRRRSGDHFLALVLASILVTSACCIGHSAAGVNSSSTLSSRGSVAYTSKPAARPVFGWGGYIGSIDQVIPILDDLASGGYTGLRYWAIPVWLAVSSSHNLNLAILDKLVDEAARRGIVVYIDSEHNYPPSAYIDAHEQEWIQDLIMVGKRYNDRPNVVLECVNEYTGSNQPAIYNRAIAELRAAGVHLPLLFNYWWNQVNTELDDPDNNYAIGRHFYGKAWDNYNVAVPADLSTVIKEAGIADAMYKYFYSTTEKIYFQSSLKLQIPNGFVVTELGPTDNEAIVGDPSVGNIAYGIAFLREGIKNNVTVLLYRIGDSSKKALYDQRASTYFGEGFLPAP